MFQLYDLKVTIIMICSVSSLSFTIQLLTSFITPFLFPVMQFYIVLVITVRTVLALPFAKSHKHQSQQSSVQAGQIGGPVCLGTMDCCGVSNTQFCNCSQEVPDVGTVCGHII